MNVTLHPSYFPNIAAMALMAKAKQIEFEVCDNFQKQTYRNRCFVYGANGKLLLNIPVVHTQKERKLYKDVLVSKDSKWQSLHWKSLESAYKTSPYFEFYEDDLRPLFKQDVKYLFDFNLKCLATIFECLQLDLNFSETSTFEKELNTNIDARSLIRSKKEITQDLNTYTQVFSTKHGFIPNLSILDLLFNEGPNAHCYLEAQSIIF